MEEGFHAGIGEIGWMDDGSNRLHGVPFCRKPLLAKVSNWLEPALLKIKRAVFLTVA
jgi:hypothetical protein